MSASFSRDDVEEAVRRVMLAVRALQEEGVLSRFDLHVVVADPAVMPWDLCRGNDRVISWILYEESFGNKAEWEYPYDLIARSKTELSWLYGMTTQRIQTEAPHLLRDGDTIYFGSAVGFGLTVGVSGVKAYHDQMIAEWILSACRAIVLEKVAKGELPLDAGGNFLQVHRAA